MRDFRLRTDVQRAVINGFALPLGIDPGNIPAPVQGYTLAYTPGEEDDPDTYVFHVVVSHERLRPVIERAFGLLPDRVFGIVEIGSRDAYRSTDVYIGEEAISRADFLLAWNDFERLLLEDGTIGIGANAEEPFIEVFIDQWKGVAIHVPLDRREEVERAMHELGLEEVPQTWSAGEEESEDSSHVRPVLDLQDEFSPDIDELLLQLRQRWQLELNVDPETNLDERGRDLGMTLWHAVVIVEDTEGAPDGGAYASVWATAASLADMNRLIERALEDQPRWRFAEIYTIDRVAFDERPEQLAALPPRRSHTEVHLVEIDPWSRVEEGAEGT